jgi:ribose 5-phosphate isomerase A
MSLDALKEQAAIRAVDFIETGMTVGLGTGSTAKHAILELGRRLKSGRVADVVGVATSQESEKLALECGIPLMELSAAGVDLAIDGADEIDPNLELIKGGGGALVREKLVEFNAKRFIVVADHTKLVPMLGYRWAVPVEILQWGSRATMVKLADIAPQVQVRLRMKDGAAVISDNGNFIADCKFREILDPRELDARMRHVPGVVGTGLFVGYADMAIIASQTGIEIFKRH